MILTEKNNKELYDLLTSTIDEFIENKKEEKIEIIDNNHIRYKLENKDDMVNIIDTIIALGW